jgi:hypothetical protein
MRLFILFPDHHSFFSFFNGLCVPSAFLSELLELLAELVSDFLHLPFDMVVVFLIESGLDLLLKFVFVLFLLFNEFQ